MTLARARMRSRWKAEAEILLYRAEDIKGRMISNVMRVTAALRESRSAACERGQSNWMGMRRMMMPYCVETAGMVRMAPGRRNTAGRQERALKMDLVDAIGVSGAISPSLYSWLLQMMGVSSPI